MGSENSKTIRESLGLIPPEIAENSLHKTVEGKNLPYLTPRDTRKLFLQGWKCAKRTHLRIRLG